MKTMKKSISIILALVMVLTTASLAVFAQETPDMPTTGGSGELYLGDINGDGKVTATDARLILRIATKLEKAEDYPDAALVADVNGDDKITAVDARIVLRVATRLEAFENAIVVIEPVSEVSSTEESTTEAPTTEAPTTEAPTTEAPTTEAPTTEAPTTEAPTTEAPTTEAPTTVAPTTEAPTTEAPTTEAPTTEAPTTEAPTTEVPTTEVPTTEVPTTEVPTTEEPTTVEPVTNPFGLPEEIAAFCSGNYYLEGKYKHLGNQLIKTATKDGVSEILYSMDGIEIGLYLKDETQILVGYSKKVYTTLASVQSLMEDSGESFDLTKDLNVEDFIFEKINIDSATSEKTTIEGKEAVIWTITSGETKLNFTVIDGKVTSIDSADGSYSIKVIKLSAKMPADLYISNSAQFKEQSAFDFFMSLYSEVMNNEG